MPPDASLPRRASASAPLCENCGKRPGVIEWVGDGGSLASVHGFTQKWCEICALDVQIEHAENVAATLPEMKARMAKLLAAGPHA